MKESVGRTTTWRRSDGAIEARAPSSAALSGSTCSLGTTLMNTVLAPGHARVPSRRPVWPAPRAGRLGVAAGLVLVEQPLDDAWIGPAVDDEQRLHFVCASPPRRISSQ